MAAIQIELPLKASKGYNGMRLKMPSTSMGIAVTILIGGFIVQITDNLEVFGKNSVTPLIIGLSFIAIGVAFFLILRIVTKSRSPRKDTSDS